MKRARYRYHYAVRCCKKQKFEISKKRKIVISNSDNYRGISLFNSINKLFDHVILYLYKDQFQSSDMQFGYKKGHSKTLCTLDYKVISHYVNNNTGVYSCLLDASKAFDRVHLGKLFSIPYILGYK